MSLTLGRHFCLTNPTSKMSSLPTPIKIGGEKSKLSRPNKFEGWQYRTRNPHGCSGDPTGWMAQTHNNGVSKAINQYEKAWTNQMTSNPVSQILFSEENIQQRVEELGSHLAMDYADKQPIFICILSGAFVFMADLIRNILPPPKGMNVDFMRVRSYDGKSTESNKVPNIFEASKTDIKGRHVVIVEDIIDTGHTLHKLLDYLQSFGAASLSVCVLLDKKCRREVPVDIQYTGFECPNEFVVGYGLDYNENYRNYSFVFKLNPEFV